MEKISAQQVESVTIFGANQFVTGVRGWTGSDVVLTGNSAGGGPTTALIYVGPLSPTDSAGMYPMPPVFEGQSVTSSTFYGPDTFLFNPELGEGNIRAVGSYQYSESSTAYNHGMLYEGPPGGGGTWTQIDVPSSAVGGQTVWNTIPHSTMGDLVVGDYDLKGVPLSANAFVYNIRKQSWQLFDFEGLTLITAYGIWQNGIGSSSYTIVGGAHDGHGSKGFVVAYDAETGAFSHLKLYSYMNQPALLTHFEGITATATGFNLASMSTASSAALASITVNSDGSFSDAAWTHYGYPGAMITTGNSIYQDTLMGIYAVHGTKGVQSYVATFRR